MGDEGMLVVTYTDFRVEFMNIVDNDNYYIQDTDTLTVSKVTGRRIAMLFNDRVVFGNLYTDALGRLEMTTPFHDGVALCIGSVYIVCMGRCFHIHCHGIYYKVPLGGYFGSGVDLTAENRLRLTSVRVAGNIDVVYDIDIVYGTGALTVGFEAFGGTPCSRSEFLRVLSMS